MKTIRKHYTTKKKVSVLLRHSLDSAFSLILSLIISISANTVYAQYDRKENITVIPFSGWQGSRVREYKEILTDKILIKIIQTNRFNVIDRSHLDRIMEEQKLSMLGIIDEATAVEAGRIIGIHKFIIDSHRIVSILSSNSPIGF